MSTSSGAKPGIDHAAGLRGSRNGTGRQAATTNAAVPSWLTSGDISQAQRPTTAAIQPSRGRSTTATAVALAASAGWSGAVGASDAISTTAATAPADAPANR